MARLHRVNPKDGIHHVNNHAVGDEVLFRDDQDRRVFLRLLEDARKRYDVVVLGYCLMGNHFHGVVLCPNGNLDMFMRHFQSRYVRFFNARHSRRGALLMERYHNELVTSDGQLQFTLRYVDRNPLELGINITTYPWGSYAFYSGFRCGRDELVTVNPRWVLSFAGSLANYAAFVERDAAHDLHRRSQGTRQILVSAEVDEASLLVQLSHIVAEVSGVPIDQVLASRRGRTNDARLVVFLVASEHGLATEVMRSVLGCRSKSTLASTLDRARRRRSECQAFAALATEVASRWSTAIDLAA